jgi:20S proteasome subunit beta 2
MAANGSVINSIRDQLDLGGFSFENTRRNAVLAGRGMKIPRAKKTGTTIVGVVYDGGVVLGADTRATEGDTVADKNCEKIHYIADNIWCCGAGTSADTENTTMLISSQLELHRMATGKQPRVVTACTMLKRMLFRYQGNVSAALVLGGVDCNGPSLYTVYPHGSTDSLPYVTMGSGSLAAMAVFESQYKSKMSLEEAKALVHAGIMAGINNDLGSGGSVDLMVIDKSGHTPLRNYDRPNVRKSKRDYTFPVGTTTVLSQTFTPITSLVTVETTVEPTGAKQMEID